MRVLLGSKKTRQNADNIMNRRHDGTELMNAETRRAKADLLKVETASDFTHRRVMEYERCSV